jgi:hypothetical protein
LRNEENFFQILTPFQCQEVATKDDLEYSCSVALQSLKETCEFDERHGGGGKDLALAKMTYGCHDISQMTFSIASSHRYM